jgi:hypothetical protein
MYFLCQGKHSRPSPEGLNGEIDSLRN